VIELSKISKNRVRRNAGVDSRTADPLGFQFRGFSAKPSASYRQSPSRSCHPRPAHPLRKSVSCRSCRNPVDGRAAYHRIVFAGEEREALHRIGILKLTAATVPFAAGLAGDVFVVIGKFVGSGEIGLLVSAGTLRALIHLSSDRPRSAAEDIGSVACRSPQERSQFGAAEAPRHQIGSGRPLRSRAPWHSIQ
jgi:hypothetical protein